MLDLAFRPDRQSGEPIFRQLAAALRDWIDTGRLAPGEKLPPSRELVAALGVSRTTVTQAYLALGELGVVRAHVGRGTFVVGPASARALPVAPHRPAPGNRRAAPAPRPIAVPRPFAWGGLLAARDRAQPPSGILRALHDTSPLAFDFRGGHVDPHSFPGRALAQACTRALRRHSAAIATHRDPRGWLALRTQIARGLVARGIVCTADDVTIVGGAQQGLDLIGRTVLDPGDTVVIEQPGYFGAALAFRTCGAHLVGVDVDERGLRTDELARLLRARRAKLLYTTPAVQSPTGVTLADDRRAALRELADRHQVPIVEDDYDAEMRLGTAAPPALKAHDPAGHVVYVGTFSKAIFPGLRIGYVVAARPLLERLAVAQLTSAFQISPLLQAALVELLASGAFERHVRAVRRLYSARLPVLLDAIVTHFPDGTVARAPAGGNSVWVTLPAHVDPTALAAAARSAGIAYERGEPYYLDPPARPALSLSFARVPVERITDGVALLGRLVRDQAPARSTRRSG